MNINSLIISFLFLALLSCEEDAKLKMKAYPLVFTKDVIEIDNSGATFIAEVTPDKNEEIIDFGFVWQNGNTEFKASLVNISTVNEFKYRAAVDLEDGLTYTLHAYLQTQKYLVSGNVVVFRSKGSGGPAITGFDPKTGPDGSIVTIVGKNFSHLQSNNKVFINNIAAQIISSSTDSIVIRTPQMAFFGNSKISVKAGTKTAISDAFFNIIGPEIYSISATKGASGDYLTLTGRYFTQSGPDVGVLFDNYSAQIIYKSDNSVDIVVPALSNSLLSEMLVVVKLVNGLKTAISKDQYLIEKSWEIKQATPFDWSWAYKAFTYNGKGYILELNTKEFYEYNPVTNQWNLFPSSLFPGERNAGSLYIVSGDKLFKLGGYDYLSQSLSEFWEFDFILKSWNKKTDLPFKFYEGVYFTLNNQLYIVTDDGQVWKCDLINEQFARMNDFPVSFKWEFASSFDLNGNAVVVTYGKTWQYNKQNDSWTSISTNPFAHLNYSNNPVGFSYNGTGYVLQAGRYLYKFDITNNRWIKTSQYPGPRGDNSYKTIFVIGDKAYFAATSSNYSGCAPLMYLYQN